MFPVEIAVRDFVQLTFEGGGEVEFDIFREEIFKECGDHPAFVAGLEAVLLHQYVVAIAEHLKRGGVGRWATNSQFFHALDQRRFGETRRRLCEVLVGVCFLDGCGGAICDFRKAVFAFTVIIIAAFLIQRKKAIKHQDGTGGPHAELFIRGGNVDCCALETCTFHLAGNGPTPDELIELEHIFIDRHVLGQAREAGWSDGFVCFLGILCLRCVDAWRCRHVERAVLSRNYIAGLCDCFGHDGNAIGTHIGNQTNSFAADIDTFIQFLSGAHGACGVEAELASGFLLQCGRCERRLWITAGGLGFYTGDGE